MKTLLVFLVVLLLCLALFFAPHHRRRPESFKSCTLAELYGEIWSDMPSFLTASAQMLLLLAICGLIACFYPAAMVLMVHQLLPLTPGVRFLFILSGVIGLAGAVVNFLGMLISHMNFAFGGSSSTKDQTAFIFVIPIIQLLFALISIVIGSSTTVASAAARMLPG